MSGDMTMILINGIRYSMIPQHPFKNSLTELSNCEIMCFQLREGIPMEDKRLVITDESASRGLDFATTCFIYSTILWVTAQVWYTF